MPRMQNPYAAQTPIGQAIANFGNAMFSGPTPLEQQQIQAQNEFYRARTDQAIADAQTAENANLARTSIGDIFRQAGEAKNARVAPALAPGLPGPTPQKAAEGLQYRQTLQSLPFDLASASAGLANSPRDVANANLMAISSSGMGDEATQAARIGAGESPLGVDQAISLQGQQGIYDRNLRGDLTKQAADPAKSPYETRAFIDISTGQPVGSFLVDRQSQQIVGPGGQTAPIPQNYVEMGKPSYQAQGEDFGGLLSGDKPSLRKAKEAVDNSGIAASQLVKQAETLDNMIASANTPEIAVGVLGKAASTLTSWALQAKAVYGAADDPALLDPAQYQEQFNSMRVAGIESAAVQGAISHMGYVIARSNDPGGGQLNKSDVENAIIEIGSGDPIAIRHNLRLIADRAVQVYNTTADWYYNQPGVGDQLPPRQDVVNPLSASPLAMPSAGAAGAGQTPEVTATNPQTGEKLRLVNGQWTPM